LFLRFFQYFQPKIKNANPKKQPTIETIILMRMPQSSSDSHKKKATLLYEMLPFDIKKIKIKN
jgi:hypothetical protein